MASTEDYRALAADWLARAASLKSGTHPHEHRTADVLETCAAELQELTDPAPSGPPAVNLTFSASAELSAENPE